MKKMFCVAFGLILVSGLGFCEEVLNLLPDSPGLLTCWTETRTVPRPLKIHYLKANLNTPDLEIVTIAGDDPDGAGPAESQLSLPVNLTKQYNALAAVNANAYSGVGGDTAGLPTWLPGHPVDIHGLAVAGGKTISSVENSRTSFWLDARRKPHIGNPASVESVLEAVSDWFSPLLIDAKVMPDPTDSALHPRTALGFDNSGSWLMLVVVDGRQQGFSEGVSLYELAQILRDQGCSQSINLDGGGSSIMLIQEPGKDLKTVNSPSGKAHRPIPVMLGVRRPASAAN